MKTCIVPGCPNVFDTPGAYCPSHKVDKAPVKRPANLGENDFRKHYFTHGWRMLSRQMIQASPVCAICGATSDLCLDHYLISAKEMVERFGCFIYDPSYYAVLCKPCNTKRRNRIPLITTQSAPHY